MEEEIVKKKEGNRVLIGSKRKEKVLSGGILTISRKKKEIWRNHRKKRRNRANITNLWPFLKEIGNIW